MPEREPQADYTILGRKTGAAGELFRRTREKYTRKREFFQRKRSFLRRFVDSEQQPAPFTSIHLFSELSGPGNVRELMETTLDAVASGMTQVILITGPPGVGKTTLSREVLHMARDRLTYAPVAFPTAERNLAKVTHHRSGSLTTEDYDNGTKKLEEHIEDALQSKKLLIVETPSTTGLYVDGYSGKLGMDRGTSALYNLFGPQGNYKDLLAGAIALTPPREFPTRLLFRLRNDMSTVKHKGPGGTWAGTYDAETDIQRILARKLYKGTDQETSVAEVMGIPHLFPSEITDKNSDDVNLILLMQKFERFRSQIVGSLLEWLLKEYFQIPWDKVFIGESRGLPDPKRDFKLP